MTFGLDLRQIHNFRDTTERSAPKMAGVMQPTRRCRDCKRYVRALGSKQFVPGQPRHGWLCPACWSERNKQETA